MSHVGRPEPRTESGDVGLWETEAQAPTRRFRPDGMYQARGEWGKTTLRIVPPWPSSLGCVRRLTSLIGDLGHFYSHAIGITCNS